LILIAGSNGGPKKRRKANLVGWYDFGLKKLMKYGSTPGHQCKSGWDRSGIGDFEGDQPQKWHKRAFWRTRGRHKPKITAEKWHGSGKWRDK